MKNRWSLKKKIITDFLNRAILNEDLRGIKRYTEKLKELDLQEQQFNTGE